MCCCVYDNKLPEPVDLERADISAVRNSKTGRLTEKKSQTNSTKGQRKMCIWDVGMNCHFNNGGRMEVHMGICRDCSIII